MHAWQFVALVILNFIAVLGFGLVQLRMIKGLQDNTNALTNIFGRLALIDSRLTEIHRVTFNRWLNSPEGADYRSHIGGGV